MTTREAIDRAIDAGETGLLCLSELSWADFKNSTPRRKYRRRVGTRFVNAYRGLPISIHDEWSWGWCIVPLQRIGRKPAQAAMTLTEPPARPIERGNLAGGHHAPGFSSEA